MVTKKSSGQVPVTEQSGVRARILEAAFSAFVERGFADASTLEIATRARASKRELYAEFGSKQDMLVACIRERAKRLTLPAGLPDLHDRGTFEETLKSIGAQLLREISDPTVIAVFRLAIAEAVRAPEVAQALNEIGIAASRSALGEIMRRAHSTGLFSGDVAQAADHFYGLLWGNRMLGLLLGLAERPSAREIAQRAERASAAFLRMYPAPE
jgi:AcrR family transcriptional regulator